MKRALAATGKMLASGDRIQAAGMVGSLGCIWDAGALTHPSTTTLGCKGRAAIESFFDVPMQVLVPVRLSWLPEFEAATWQPSVECWLCDFPAVATTGESRRLTLALMADSQTVLCRRILPKLQIGHRQHTRTGTGGRDSRRWYSVHSMLKGRCKKTWQAAKL